MENGQDYFAENPQQQTVDMMGQSAYVPQDRIVSSNIASLVGKCFSGSLFLSLAILQTCITFAYILNTSINLLNGSDVLASFMHGVFYFIPNVLFTVGVWMLYAVGKKNDVKMSTLRLFKAGLYILFILIAVGGTIYTILTGVFSAFEWSTTMVVSPYSQPTIPQAAEEKGMTVVSIITNCLQVITTALLFVSVNMALRAGARSIRHGKPISKIGSFPKIAILLYFVAFLVNRVIEYIGYPPIASLSGVIKNKFVESDYVLFLGSRHTIFYEIWNVIHVLALCAIGILAFIISRRYDKEIAEMNL